MIKLLQWLSVAVPILAVWLSIVLGYVGCKCFDKWMDVIIASPIIFVFFFGLYAASVVLYRVSTFKTCEDAYDELKVEISEAQADLKSKGFKF